MLRMTIKKIQQLIKQPHIVFILISLLFGLVFIKITPPLWGLDEPSHTARVFHILRGEFVSDGDNNNPANFMPANYNELIQYRVSDILDFVRMDNIISRKDVTDINVYKKITSNRFDKSEYFSSYIANYSPVAYPGPIVGLAVAKTLNLNMGHSLTLMRFMGLLSYIAIAAFAIWIIRNYKLKWLFVTLALVPMAIFQASVVTADTMVIGTTLLFFALVYRIALEKEVNRKLLIALAVVSVLIPLIKLNHVIIVLIIAAIPAYKFGSLKRAWIYKGLVIATSIFLALLWAQFTHVTATPGVSQRADQAAVSPSEQISYAVHNPIKFGQATGKSFVIFGDAYYRGLLFTVSGNSVETPVVATITLSFVILLAALIAKKELLRLKRIIIWSCVACLVFVASVFGALYASFTPVGWPFVDGVQGRYFFPLLIPVTMLVAMIIPIQVKVESKKLKLIIIAATTFCLTVSVAYVYTALY